MSFSAEGGSEANLPIELRSDRVGIDLAYIADDSKY